MEGLYKNAMWSNVVIVIGVAICITFAAVRFEKTSVLWWYMILPFIKTAISVKEEHKGKEDSHS